MLLYSRFYTCLCALDSYKCHLHLVDYFDGEGLPCKRVASVGRETQTGPASPEPVFTCEPSVLANGFNITCVRSPGSFRQVCGDDSSCHARKINLTEFDSCDITCVSIIWTDARYVLLSTVDDNVKAPKATITYGECPAASIGTPDVPGIINEPNATSLSFYNTTWPPVPPSDNVTSGPVLLARVLDKGGDSAEGLGPLEIAMWVALYINLGIAAGLGVLYWRKQTRQQRQARFGEDPSNRCTMEGNLIECDGTLIQ